MFHSAGVLFATFSSSHVQGAPAARCVWTCGALSRQRFTPVSARKLGFWDPCRHGVCESGWWIPLSEQRTRVTGASRTHTHRHSIRCVPSGSLTGSLIVLKQAVTLGQSPSTPICVANPSVLVELTSIITCEWLLKGGKPGWKMSTIMGTNWTRKSNSPFAELNVS